MSTPTPTSHFPINSNLFQTPSNPVHPSPSGGVFGNRTIPSDPFGVRSTANQDTTLPSATSPLTPSRNNALPSDTGTTRPNSDASTAPNSLDGLLNGNNTASSDTLDQELIRALLRCLAGQGESPKPKKRVAKPEKWDGTLKGLNTFLAQLALVFRREHFASEEEKVDYACSYLSGKAAQSIQLFLVLDDVQRPSYFSTWELFKTELTRRFGERDQIEAHADRLFRLEQTSSTASYVSDFNNQAYILESMNREPVTYMFLCGLKPDVRVELARSGMPKDLHSLQELAVNLDHRLQRSSALANSPASATANSLPLLPPPTNRLPPAPPPATSPRPPASDSPPPN